jgi:hypothetical protein
VSQKGVVVLPRQRGAESPVAPVAARKIAQD